MTAEQSQQGEAAWQRIDPATREKLSFLSAEDFIVAHDDESAEQWQRFTEVLDRAEQYRGL